MNKCTFRKAAIAAAMTTTFGITAVPASAAVVEFSWSGYFSWLSSGGTVWYNISSSTNTYGGYRTAIAGTMVLDTDTGVGSATVNSFDLVQRRVTSFIINMQAIGDGSGGPGTLVLGNMSFDWNTNYGIPASTVFDATGLFGAISSPGFGVGTTISGTGTYAASEGAAKGIYSMGLLPIATTTWNTTTIPGAAYGSNPSGSLPLITDTVLVTDYDGDPLAAGYQQACAVDASTATGWQCALGVGGNPMINGPFQGSNFNLDVTSVTVTSVTAVPIPAAVWLLGSGLLGLLGMARRRVLRE